MPLLPGLGGIINVGGGAAGLDFSALPNLPAERQSSDGWIDQATIDSFANAAIWLDAANTFSDTGATVAALTGDLVAAIKDNAAARTWTQANAGNQMTLAATPTRLIGDHNKTVVGTGNTPATGANIVIATNAGILNAVGNIGATQGVRNISGMIHWISGAFSAGDIDRIKAFAVAEGAVDDNFASVTNFSNLFRSFNFITSFPLINTSSATSFSSTWHSCTGLATFPLIDTSAGENFFEAWRNCSGLASFPANVFDGCAATNFTNAFVDTALTEASIDGILVSINSNGTSSGTFNQSGGTAPSVATGRPAIDAMRGRGWTVTVTGGY